jgi:hypothetical protein
MRTFDLQGGADTMITLYRNNGGSMQQIAQNDEDPANTSSIPMLAGPSRISYSITTTDTVLYGNTFYARINSPNPGNYGCDRTYKLSLSSSPTVWNGAGAYQVSMLSSGRLSWPVPTDSGQLVSDVAFVAPVEPAPEAVQATAPQRLSFSIILELRGGGP